MIYVQGNIDQLPAHAQPSDSYFNNNEPTNRMIEEDDQPMICMICEDKVDIHSSFKRSIGFTIGFHNQGEGPY